MLTVLVHDPLFEVQGYKLLGAPESPGEATSAALIMPIPSLYDSLWGPAFDSEEEVEGLERNAGLTRKLSCSLCCSKSGSVEGCGPSQSIHQTQVQRY